MARYAVAVLVVIGLAAGVMALWSGRGESPNGTLPDAGATTTTPTTTSTSLPTTTSLDVDHVVRTVEEAEAILRALWFGWFEGIYNQDEDRIREVVATEEQVEVARQAFGSEFLAVPSEQHVVVSNSEILRTDSDCLVVWATLDVTDLRGPEALATRAFVMRWQAMEWRILASWTLRDGGWESDCDASLP